MYSYYDVDQTALFAALSGFFMVIGIIGTIIGVLTIIAMWKIFVKAGKPGWASLIPIYNAIVLFQIVNLSPWLLLLSIVPIVNIIAMFIISIMLCLRLAKAFQKGTGFAIGLIFLNTIFILILGLGDSKYVGITE